MQAEVQQETVQRLRAKLQRYQDRRARRAGWARRFVPTSLARLDAVLPHGGLPCGAVTEILAEAPGTGSMTLAMRVARQALWSITRPQPSGPMWHWFSTGEVTGWEPAQHVSPEVAGERALIVLDTTGDFYPPAVATFGIDPQRLIVIRTTARRDAFWAMDQSLRCAGVAVVIAALDGLDERQSRRLQLAAEVSGSMGLILAAPQPRTRSFAAVRMSVRPFAPSSLAPDAVLKSGAKDRFLASIDLLAVREGMPTGPFLVDLHHATGACDLHPLPVNRSVARTG